MRNFAIFLVVVLATLVSPVVDAFAPSSITTIRNNAVFAKQQRQKIQQLYFSDNSSQNNGETTTTTTTTTTGGNRNNNNEMLEQKFGGYTAKQRLREEVESPFRTVRLFFFGSSTASALLALYFSLLNVLKATQPVGTYALDAPGLDESLQSVAINVVAVLVCGAITYRDWQAGNANLARIAKGGMLAKLSVSTTATGIPIPTTLSEYRRNARVVLAAGGASYIQELCRMLNADQLSDTNMFAEGLDASDVIVIPILLQQDGQKDYQVGDSQAVWMATEPDEENDRNFDVSRSSKVIAFPLKSSEWKEYLQSEIETCQKQGFDVFDKGFTITVKKNGRILRRATGQPPLPSLIGTMEVLDGSKFGMPGDDEKYGS